MPSSHLKLRNIRVALLAVLVTIVSTGLRAATPAEIETKIDALIARMTLEEKLGQMSQVSLTRLTDKTREEIRQGRWGSLYGGAAPAQWAEAQRIALKESRLGIPLIFAQDVIHGHTTTFPIPLGQSASWDPELVRQAARVAAREAAGAGLHWTFSPMMDIARDPRWGRIAERTLAAIFSFSASPVDPERSSSPSEPSASMPITSDRSDIALASSTGVSFTLRMPFPPTTLLVTSLPNAFTHPQRS